jgi:hypothetical protein
VLDRVEHQEVQDHQVLTGANGSLDQREVQDHQV